MPTVRVTKAPRLKTGDQYDYGLVTIPPQFGNLFPGQNGYTNPTLEPIERSQANAEAERGETMITPDENSPVGFSHQLIGGKTHGQGGTPVFMQPNSFVFSNTKRLRIKDPDLLAHFNKTGKGSGAKGYTPAELAKQYPIDKIVLAGSDPGNIPDKFAQASQQRMLQVNAQKLAELALTQEALKGMPKGVPGFAETTLGLEQPPMMRFGGQLEKFQDGGSKAVKGKVVYIGGVKHTVKERKASLFGDEKVVFDTPVKLRDRNGKLVEVTEMNATDVDKGLSQKYLRVGQTNALLGKTSFGNIDNLGLGEAPFSMPGKVNHYSTVSFSDKPGKTTMPASGPKKGTRFSANGEDYEVIDGDGFDKRGRKVQLRQLTKNDKSIGASLDRFSGNKVVTHDEYNAMRGLNPATGKNSSNVKAPQEYVPQVYSDDAPVATAKPAARPAAVRSTGGRRRTSRRGTDSVSTKATKTVSSTVTPVADREHVKFDVKPIATPSTERDNALPASYADHVKVANTQRAGILNPEQIEPEDVVHQSRNWYPQDLMGIAGSMIDLGSIKKYNPSLIQLQQPDTGQFVPVDPTQAIHAVQSTGALTARTMENMSDSSVARANLLGLNAEISDKAAEITGQYVNQNAQGATQFSQQAGQMRTQVNNQNSELFKRYLDEQVVANQQYDNAQREGRDRIRQRLGRGFSNRQNLDMVNAMSAQQFYYDPMEGIQFTGSGDTDFGSPAASGGITGLDTGEDSVMAQGRAMKQLVDQYQASGLSASMAETMVKQHMSQQNSLRSAAAKRLMAKPERYGYAPNTNPYAFADDND